MKSLFIILFLLSLGDPARANDESMGYLNSAGGVTAGMKNLDNRTLMLNQRETEDQTSKQYEECIRRSLHGNRSGECAANPDADACVGAIKAMEYSKKNSTCVIKMQRYCLRTGFKQNTSLGWLNVAKKHYENASICLNQKSGQVGSDNKRDDLFILDRSKLAKDSKAASEMKGGEFKAEDRKLAKPPGGSASELAISLDDGSSLFGMKNGTILSRVRKGEDLLDIVGRPQDDGEPKAFEVEVNGAQTAAAPVNENRTEDFVTEAPKPAVNPGAKTDAEVNDLLKLLALSEEQKAKLCAQWGYLGTDPTGPAFANRGLGTGVDYAAIARAGAAGAQKRYLNISPDGGVNDTTTGARAPGSLYQGTSLFQMVNRRYRSYSPFMTGMQLNGEKVDGTYRELIFIGQ